MIKNISQKFVLSNEYKICGTFWSQAIGLMFRSKSKHQDMVFVLPKIKKLALSMMFVFYPIDVLYLDENFKVVEIKRNFKPFTFYNPKKKAKYVLELKNCGKTKVGDKIILNYSA